MEQYNLFWKEEITHDAEDFTSQIEWVGEFIYLHCKVHKNTPASIRAVKRELSRLLNRFKKEGVETVYAYLEKGRFAEMLGGVYLTSFESEGKYYEVFSYATSSSTGSCSDCSSGQYIRKRSAEQGPEEGGKGTAGSGRYRRGPAEESGNGGPSPADSPAENPSSAGATGSVKHWSLSEFW